MFTCRCEPSLCATLSSRRLASSGRSDQATLGTFIPPAATVDLRTRANQIAVTERALGTDTVFGGDDLVQLTIIRPMCCAKDSRASAAAAGDHPATSSISSTAIPSPNRSSQPVVAKAPAAYICSKLGSTWAQHDGSSLSRPVLIERSDGRRRRLDFLAAKPTVNRRCTPRFSRRDRFQPTTRWYLEFGGWLDRDGVVERLTTPRQYGGVAERLERRRPARRIWPFYERTPSMAGAFDQFAQTIPAMTAMASRPRFACPVCSRDCSKSPDTAQPDAISVTITGSTRCGPRTQARSTAMGVTSDRESLQTDTGGEPRLSSGRSIIEVWKSACTSRRAPPPTSTRPIRGRRRADL